MKINVYLEKYNKKKVVDTTNLKDLLKKLDINPTAVIISRNNELITEKTKLNNNDKIKIIPVVSGG